MVPVPIWKEEALECFATVRISHARASHHMAARGLEADMIGSSARSVYPVLTGRTGPTYTEDTECCLHTADCSKGFV